MEKSLTNGASLKALLQAHGIRPRRSDGQNFLICDDVIAKTLAALGSPIQGAVTELGSGAGVLTQALLAEGFLVRALERDRPLVEFIRKTVPDQLVPSLELVVGDLRRELWEWDRPYSLVGNIPYYLSGFIIRRVTQLGSELQRVVLLVQREVGQRLVSRPPDLQLIGLAVQLWGDAEVLAEVSADCFWPVPKVDSQLVLLTPKVRDRLALAEREQIMALAGHFFRARRKQMGGVLKRLRKISTSDAHASLVRAGIDPAARPQEIPEAQWVQLYRTIQH